MYRGFFSTHCYWKTYGLSVLSHGAFPTQRTYPMRHAIDQQRPSWWNCWDKFVRFPFCCLPKVYRHNRETKTRGLCATCARTRWGSNSDKENWSCWGWRNQAWLQYLSPCRCNLRSRNRFAANNPIHPWDSPSQNKPTGRWKSNCWIVLNSQPQDLSSAIRI